MSTRALSALIKKWLKKKMSRLSIQISICLKIFSTVLWPKTCTSESIDKVLRYPVHKTDKHRWPHHKKEVCWCELFSVPGARLQLNLTSKSWRLSVNWRCMASASTQQLTEKAPKLIWPFPIWACRFFRWLLLLTPTGFIDVTTAPLFVADRYFFLSTFLFLPGQHKNKYF